MPDETFRKCALCETTWKTRADFLRDKEIALIGYQTNFVAIEKGLFLFNHICNTTLSLPVAAFADLYDGPIYTEHKTGSKECPGYCLYKNNMRPCPGNYPPAKPGALWVNRSKRLAQTLGRLKAAS